MTILESKIESIRNQLNTLVQHPNNLPTWHYLSGYLDALLFASMLTETEKQEQKKLEWKS